MARVVIWGLRTSKHSHRYIHAGWYRTLRVAGYDVWWTDDRPSAAAAVDRGSIVFSVDVASKHLPIRTDCRYVLHNFDFFDRLPGLQEMPTRLRLQVWTTKATGISLDPSVPCVKYDNASHTLYQPWGTPFLEREWARQPLTEHRGREYWIGSIWNDEQNQGNAPMIAEWSKALRSKNLRFTKVVRGWPDSPRAYGSLVRRSALAASVVGDWQSTHEYLPCRMFKNLSFGAVPVGNNVAYQHLFGDAAVVSNDLEALIEEGSAAVRDNERLAFCQQRLGKYTHLAGLERMMELVRSYD